MKKNTILSFSVISIFFISMVSLAIVINPAGAQTIDYEPMEVGPEFREKNLPIDESSFPSFESESQLRAKMGGMAESVVGDQKLWLSLDDYAGVYFFDVFELKALTANTEVWVQLDLSWPDGDPRPTPVVTNEQAEYLANEFDNNMAAKEHAFFGEPDFHDGSNALLEAWGYGEWRDPTGRQVVLVSNIGDDNYYDPTYPSYIAGFYSSTFEAYFDRNIMSIDSYDWANRLGEEGGYVYEGTFAHEYQHLIHDDYVDSSSWINEGFSMYAETFVGYGVQWGYINYFLQTPDNSLLEWGDQGGINILADYGAGYMFTTYVEDHFAGFISQYMANGVADVDGLNLALADLGFDAEFEELFHNWRIANLIHTDFPGHGKYNYKTFDLGDDNAIDVHTNVVDVSGGFEGTGSSFGTTISRNGYDTGNILLNAYGSDYVQLDGLSSYYKVKFDGNDEAGAGWELVDEDGDGDLEWYSTPAGAEKDINIVAPLDLTGETTATLSFDTKYDIEDFWDFGFVQVSTDDGATWTSLENEYTTYDYDPNAYPDIIAQLPGLTSWTGGEWISMSFNLDAYVGQSVLLSFRYMTDWGTEYPGWWVDNVAVNGVVIDDADSNVAFSVVKDEVDFDVTVVQVLNLKHGRTISLVFPMFLYDATESGFYFSLFSSKYVEATYLIVTPDVGPSDYSLNVFKQSRHWGHHGHYGF